MVVNDGRTLVDTSVIDRSSPEVVDEACLLLAGRYQLLQPLGGGGMGNVYLAEDRLLSRQVAIKTIRPELSANEEVRSRIKRECRFHAAIGTHPHIITLFDTFEENGHIYLVMEYFAGKTLAARLAAPVNGAGIGVKGALEIVHQLLLALETIHGAGIVHRDIKTANILIAERDHGDFLAKLTDFGIARSALDDETVTRLTALDVQGPGTPAYMAPERIDPQSFGPIGPAADLYAVGVILYELLTGRPPFRGTMTEIFSGHLVQTPDLDALPEMLPPQIKGMLEAALTKQPAHRFADARSFIEAVESIRTTLPEDGQIPAPVPVAGNPLAGDHTLLASFDAEANTDETQLHPRLAQKRSAWVVSKKMVRWMGGGIALLVLLAIAFLLFRGSGVEKLPPQPPETTAAAVPPKPEPEKTIPVPAPSGTPPTVSALETLETARQQKSTESMTTAERTRTSDSGEWQVIENRSRKIH